VKLNCKNACCSLRNNERCVVFVEIIISFWIVFNDFKKPKNEFEENCAFFAFWGGLNLRNVKKRGDSIWIERFRGLSKKFSNRRSIRLLNNFFNVSKKI